MTEPSIDTDTASTVIPQPPTFRRRKPQWGLIAAVVVLVLATLSGVGVALATQQGRVDAQAARLDTAQAERQELHDQVSELASALGKSQENALQLYDQLLEAGQEPAGVDPRVIPGPIGPAGESGAIGPRGATGEPGIAGAVGAPGEPGRDGADGANGVNGSDGATGAAGQNGADGAPGPAGPPGSPGPACPNGFAPTLATVLTLDNNGDQTPRQAIVCLPTDPAPAGEGASQ
ncbi:hypothetical protein QE418_003369 [Microbacterium testaceum]|uniref:hypothetical protein n=1 Tax=Microbacterium TaxID=33882 RepID=UPI002784DD8B|nr:MULTISPECIES: hypothetical protein [Microbacterium]MDQ1113921.1 hypothetical protein [Microbacterium testaceum]MDR6098972.1 hypothetical protein [Microbacterium sp. SORGH_AS_0454]